METDESGPQRWEWAWEKGREQMFEGESKTLEGAMEAAVNAACLDDTTDIWMSIGPGLENPPD